MKEITVRKDKLLAVLRENREQHAAEFAEAAKQYRLVGVELLRRRLQAFEVGDEPVEELRLQFEVSPPRNYTDEYDRSIQMLEMAEDETFVVSRNEFARYVQDEWAWKGHFEAANRRLNAVSDSLGIQ